MAVINEEGGGGGGGRGGGGGAGVEQEKDRDAQSAFIVSLSAILRLSRDYSQL